MIDAQQARKDLAWLLLTSGHPHDNEIAERGNNLATFIHEALTKLSEQAARVKVLEDALRWYADAENYHPKVIDGVIEDDPIFLDEGNRAREALLAPHGEG